MIASLFFPAKRKKLVIWSLALLYLFSNEFIYNEVALAYEHPHPSEKELKPKYEAAIILGGLSHYNHLQNLLEFEGSSDRMLNILPLYFDGRIAKIIIAGGSGRLTQDEKESIFLKDYLLKIGVRTEDILTEDRSRNTYENAKYTQQLLQEYGLKGPFLLSTSASHMPRSLAIFSKLELSVDPYPVDYLSREREYHPDRLFIPKSHTLKSWRALVHEWVGFIAYKMMGYC